MSLIYTPHYFQEKFHLSTARIRLAAAAKRAGKTEAGAIETIIYAEEKRGYRPNGIDPYTGVIVAPTTDMLRRLSIQKLMAYGKHFIANYHQTHNEIDWHNGTKIYGISADKPQRLEGLKVNFAWVDESLQVSEHLFMELLARVSDTQGSIWMTGSLGVNFTNPKNHWCYKYFKQRPIADSECIEWTTADNPYFPKEELERLKDTLDPRTYRQMFTIDWSVPGSSLVYDEFSEANELIYNYNPHLPTYISIDFGWAHPMACLFFQYDYKTDTVYLFDEIIKSKLKIETLYDLIMAKPYRIDEWICDIAGNQEREQTGISNVQWFKARGVHFKFRQSAINKGVSIVRSYIRNGKGQVKFYVDKNRCPKTLDCIYNYSYEEKNGQIVSENPIKEDDDPCDALRYYFVNKHDKLLKENEVQMLKR